MRFTIIFIIVFCLQLYAVLNIKLDKKEELSKQNAINMNASNFSFIKPEPIVEEVVKKIPQDEGIKKEIKPKKIVKKHTKKVQNISKTEAKSQPTDLGNNNITKPSPTNGENIVNNASNGNNNQQLAMQINALLNKYKKYPKKAKLLNIQGKVAGNFIVSKDGLSINITECPHEIFMKETKQTIKKIKNKIPQQAHNIKISFVINYK